MSHPTWLPPSGAICGRADLVRALMHGDDDLLAAVAARLGYELPAGSAEGRCFIRPVAFGRDEPVAGGVEPPPVLASLPLQPARFWQASERTEQRQASPPKLEDGPVELPDWSARPRELARARPLAEWHTLLPLLRRAMAEPAVTRALDISAIVRRLGRGESLRRLPRQRRRRWGLSLHIVEDRSDHLAPYWADQEVVRDRLAKLFPHYAVEHALWYEGLREPVWAGAARRRDPYRLPPPGSLVVVLGDLGCLLRGGGHYSHWLELGRRLRAERCRTLALTPAPSCLEPVQRYWRLLRWERLPPERDSAARAAVVARLLALAGNALRLEPGLLRGLRLLVGADAGAESEVWQDRTVIGRSSVAATLSPDEAQQRRQAFLAEPEPVRRQALALQRAWRAGLPPEIWLAELQSLDSDECERLAGSSDARDSRDFIAALGRQAAGLRGAAPVPGAIPWFRDVVPWLRGGYLEDPALGDYFYAIWAEILRRDPRQKLPLGLRPERLPESRPARRVTLFQHGGTLCARYSADAAAHPGFIAQADSANAVIRLEAPRFGDAGTSFWEGGVPPTWAADWGWDRYGAWVEFAIEVEDGASAVQRMRWIEPGRFLMGSPQDEPERYQDEGPLHAVTIAEGFWLFETACTQVLWEAVMGENPARFRGVQRPVERVSWDQVQDFIARLNARRPGLDLCLPSEAQWEYACRAGTQTPFSLGANIAPEAVNYNGNYPYADGAKGIDRKETVPVRSLPANPWGLFEMHGNVYEWMQDAWHASYDGAPADGSAWENASGAGRVVRGGSWGDYARDCRCAYRFRFVPGLRGANLGFRCARAQVRKSGQAGGTSGASGRAAARPAVAEGGARPPAPRRSEGQGWPGTLPMERDDAVPGGWTDGAMLLRLEPSVTASAALPDATALILRTDRESLTLRRTLKPAWASAMGRDRYGLWAEIAVEPETGGPAVVQRLRWIPPGRLLMGSPEDEPGRWEDEGPRHPVAIGAGFWLFDSPCTQALWTAAGLENPSRFVDPERPVERTSWNDAQGFIARLNERIPGLRLCLPGEAQWEYACRAATETALYSGPIEIRGDLDAPALDPIAWYGGNSGVDYDLEEGEDSTKGWWEGKRKQYNHTQAGTRKVKRKAPNVWGLYDMLGNVWEWVADGWHGSYTGAPADGSAWQTDDPGAGRVVRGGSWIGLARRCRCAYRYQFEPDYRFSFLGFRCARVQVE